MAQYRLNSSDDLEKFYQLYLYAFNAVDGPRRRKFFFERCRHGLVYGLKKDERLASALYSLPFTVDFHGIKYKMNGIGDVATAPESSGQGGASTLLQAALEEMSAAGVTLSYLAPFSYQYYRRFGYEQVFNHLHYSLSNQKIPKFKPKQVGGKIVRGKLADHLPELAQFYASYANSGLKGGMLREQWWWNYLTLKNDWFVGIYYDEDQQVQGYVIYELAPERLVVKEMLYLNSGAFEQLAAFIFNHKNTVRSLLFDSPAAIYQGDWLADPDSVQVEVLPYMMARIVDLKDFLLRYPYVKENFAPITFGIEDQNLPQNSGIWELSAINGKVSIQKTAELVSDTTDKITIQEFTKAAFGAQNINKLVLHGKADLSLKIARQLDEILVKEPPEFVDYF